MRPETKRPGEPKERDKGAAGSGALLCGTPPDGRAVPASRVDFKAVNRAALAALPAILARWLLDGHREGHEYVALNPCRADHHLGSFRINLATGRWADFATGDRGGDPVSLAAYLAGIGQAEAARNLAAMLWGRTMPDRGLFEPLAPDEVASSKAARQSKAHDDRWTPLPKPADAVPDFRHRDLGEPARLEDDGPAVWEYRNAAGEVEGYQ